MPITLPPQTEARLREKAAREGQAIDSVADSLIQRMLDWEEQDYAEAVEAIQRSDQAAAEGRERPLLEFIAEQRSKHGFSAEWPHGAHLGK